MPAVSSWYLWSDPLTLGAPSLVAQTPKSPDFRKKDDRTQALWVTSEWREWPGGRGREGTFAFENAAVALLPSPTSSLNSSLSPCFRLRRARVAQRAVVGAGRAPGRPLLVERRHTSLEESGGMDA